MNNINGKNLFLKGLRFVLNFHTISLYYYAALVLSTKKCSLSLTTL